MALLIPTPAGHALPNPDHSKSCQHQLAKQLLIEDVTSAALWKLPQELPGNLLCALTPTFLAEQHHIWRDKLLLASPPEKAESISRLLRFGFPPGKAANILEEPGNGVRV